MQLTSSFLSAPSKVFNATISPFSPRHCVTTPQVPRPTTLMGLYLGPKLSGGCPLCMVHAVMGLSVPCMHTMGLACQTGQRYCSRATMRLLSDNFELKT